MVPLVTVWCVLFLAGADELLMDEYEDYLDDDLSSPASPPQTGATPACASASTVSTAFAPTTTAPFEAALRATPPAAATFPLVSAAPVTVPAPPAPAPTGRIEGGGPSGGISGTSYQPGAAGVGHGGRVIQARPNLISRTIVPTTKDEVNLAFTCTAEAKSSPKNKTWDDVLVSASFRYNVVVVSNTFLAGRSGSSAGQAEIKDLRGPVDAQTFKDFGIQSSKFASGPLREAAVKWTAPAPGAVGAAGQGTGRGKGAGRGKGRGGGRRGDASTGAGSSPPPAGPPPAGPPPAGTPLPAGPPPAGNAGPGEVLELTDDDIDALGTNMLRRTLRSLQGGHAPNALKAPELREMLRRAVREGKRRKHE